MELYVDLFSQPCRSVFMVAKALGIPFELKNVELLEGQQYSEDFAKLSLVKKVPVMKDGNFVLTESIRTLRAHGSRMYQMRVCDAHGGMWGKRKK
uniref:GST N-terminal domain-containing protein n=1 Tax=Gouania willdenowi TaxID=441366 RepID=A0A8C5E3N2_GOUWI